jgi:hypothetical protein
MSLKRKFEDTETILPAKKVAKSNVHQYLNDDKRVLILTCDNEENFIPQLFSFPVSLYSAYKPMFKCMKTRREAYKPVLDLVLKQIDHLEDVKHFYTTTTQIDEEIDDPISYMDLWFHALSYWFERKVINILLDDVPVKEAINVTHYLKLLIVE